MKLQQLRPTLNRTLKHKVVCRSKATVYVSLYFAFYLMAVLGFDVAACTSMKSQTAD